MPSHKPVKLIRASAGSGKTFALTAHYLVLVFGGTGRYREILAVTFTNKATAEMKERILSALQELATSGYAHSRFSAILQHNYPGLSDHDVREKASLIYSSILHDYSRFSVSTIDGFVQQLIRSFAFELNIDSGYKLEMNQERVKSELIRSLNLFLEHDPDLLLWVTNLAIDRISDGKNWDYQQALKSLADEIFKERYYPFQDAMGLMGDRQPDEFNKLREKVSSGIDTFKKEIIERTGKIKQAFDQSGVTAAELSGKSKNPLLHLHRILNGDLARISTLEKLADNFEEWPHGTLKDRSEIELLYTRLNPGIKDLLHFYYEGSERYETFLAINKNSSYLRLMQGMAELLKNYRSENGVLLISDAQNLIKGITNSGSDPDNLSFIWEKTGNKYKYFLFDEFQDTSTFQWVNFHPLIRNAIAQSQRQHPEHLIVGDVKQSIYRWRNGDWRILHRQVTEDLGLENVSEENLEFNRRSSENIIRFNNFLYSRLPAILQQQLNDHFYETAAPNLHGLWESESSRLIEEAYKGSTQRTTDDTLEGGAIEVRFFSAEEVDSEEPDQSFATSYTVEKLAGLLSSGIRMKDIGILVRKNDEATEILECLLDRANQKTLSDAAGKPFQVISGEALKIANNIAVQLLISTLRMLSTPEHENGIYKAECARLWYQIHQPEAELINIDGNAWMDMAATSLSGLSHILPPRLCAGFNSFHQLPLGELTEKLITIYELGTPGARGHIPYLLAFRDQVTLFSSAGDQGMGAFLDWWETDGSSAALPSSDDQDAVRIMTIHKSKGLEFRAVIVPFVNWKLNTFSSGLQRLIWVNAGAAGFPDFVTLPVDYSKSLAATVFASGFYEEMLLAYMDTLNTLYVATTRAKDYLCLICPKLPATERKTGTVNDIQVILSELLSQEGDNHSLINEEGSFTFGEVPSRIKSPEKDENSYLALEHYHVNEELTERFKRNTPNQDVWFNARQRKGVVLHALLAVINGLQDYDKLIDEKVQEGLIRVAEKEEISKAIEDVLRQEDIRSWFMNAERVISEKDMILESGNVRRPDKLFLFKDHAVLLDFKFGAEKTKYREDIILYRDNLLKMGSFGEVQAYIWYALEGKLQKV